MKANVDVSLGSKDSMDMALNGSSTYKGDPDSAIMSASVSSYSSASSRNTSSVMVNNAKNLLFSQRSPRIL